MKPVDQIICPMNTAFIHFALSRGLPENRLCELTGLEMPVLGSLGLGLDAAQLLAVIQEIQQVTGDPFPGLHAGESVRYNYLGAVGYLMMTCRTYYDALRRFADYYELVGNFCHFQFSLRHNQAECLYVPIRATWQPLEQHILEGLLSSFQAVGNDLLGSRIPYQRVDVTWPAPQDLSEYHRLFGSHLRFNQPQVALYFDKTYLKLPIEQSEANLLLVLEDHIRQCYRKRELEDAWSHRVLKALKTGGQELQGLDGTALRLGVSPRTLQLKLKEEGVGFQELRHQVLLDQAKRYLNNDHYSVSKVSRLLGFAEPSSFYRAFKQQTGYTPGEYRSRYGQLM